MCILELALIISCFVMRVYTKVFNRCVEFYGAGQEISIRPMDNITIQLTTLGNGDNKLHKRLSLFTEGAFLG